MSETVTEIDRREIAAQLRAIGAKANGEVMQSCCRLFAGFHASLAAPAMKQDVAYGPDPRNRLDVYYDPRTTGALPVLLFVHGGGFVGGDKNLARQPFYANVGRWAVDHGMRGVTMNYRLAPANPWPAGADDIAAAVSWARSNAAAYGLDANRIVLFGHSAGAAHVADYIAHRSGAGVAGAVMVSGIYDPVADNGDDDEAHAYYGDRARQKEASPLQGLASTDIPFMLTVSEWDPPRFHRSAVAVLTERMRRELGLPVFYRLDDQNHFSTLFDLGVSGERLGPKIDRFVKKL